MDDDFTKKYPLITDPYYKNIRGSIQFLLSNKQKKSNIYTVSPIQKAVFGDTEPNLIPEMVACLPSDEYIKLCTDEINIIKFQVFPKMNAQCKKLQAQVDSYQRLDPKHRTDEQKIVMCAHDQLLQTISRPYTEGEKAALIKHLFDNTEYYVLPKDIQKVIIPYMSYNTNKLVLVPKTQKFSFHELGLLAQWYIPEKNPSTELMDLFVRFSYYQAMHNNNLIRFTHGEKKEPLYWPKTFEYKHSEKFLLPLPFRLMALYSMHQRDFGTLEIGDPFILKGGLCENYHIYLAKFPYEFSKKADWKCYKDLINDGYSIQTIETSSFNFSEGDEKQHYFKNPLSSYAKTFKLYVEHEPIEIPDGAYPEFNFYGTGDRRSLFLKSSYYLDDTYRQNITSLIQALSTRVEVLRQNAEFIKGKEVTCIPHTTTTYQEVLKEYSIRISIKKAIDELCFGQYKYREDNIKDVEEFKKSKDETRRLLAFYKHFTKYLTKLRDSSASDPQNTVFVSAGYFKQ